MKPYIDIPIWKNIRIRTFIRPDDSQLVWHRDKADRLCVVLYGKDWKYQADNKLPVELKFGDNIVIRKNVYHRIIKGASILVLLIKEFEHEPKNEDHKRGYESHHKTHSNIHSL